MQDIVGRINGTPIQKADFANALQGYSMETWRKTSDQLSTDELVQAEEIVRERLLARELIFQDALAMGLVATEEQVDEEKAKIIGNFPNEDEFYATLEKAGITPLDYHRMVRQDVTVEQLKQRKLTDLAEPTEEEITKVYQEHPEQMVIAGRVRAAHILLRLEGAERTEVEAEMAELKQRSAGEDFGKLAKQHSKCPSAPGGGDLGYFRKGDMVKNFEEVAFSLPIGEISDPVETQFGLHLIKVIDREKERQLGLDEARPKIIGFLKDEAAARLLQGWVEDLKELARIEWV